MIVEPLTLSNLDWTAWGDLEPAWQEKLQRAVAIASPPSGIVFPRTPAELGEVMQQASDRALPVLPCGSGSKLGWGGLLQQSVPLAVSTQRLNRIIDHAVGDLTVTVEAGVKFADLQATLKPSGQFLPLNPAYPKSTTVGGLVATGDSWPQSYGGVRDLVLGLSFVRADGKLAKAGGRVVKNVAGYDLMKLFSGSYGTLGIISQVTFRTYPLPATSQTAILTGERDRLVPILQALLASRLTPTAADLLSPAVVQHLQLGEGLGLVARFQGIAESVSEQISQLKVIHSDAATVQFQTRSEAAETELWQQLQHLLCVPASAAAITGKLGLLPAAATSFLSQLDAGELGIVCASSGLGRLQLAETTETKRIRQLRSRCQERQGFLTLLEAPTDLKKILDPWGYTGNALDLMRAIKHQFDPHSLLNPGRFVGGI